MLHSLRALYAATKSFIVLNDKAGEYFVTTSGVRQGDILFPKACTKNSIQVAHLGYWLQNQVARTKLRWPRFNIY